MGHFPRLYAIADAFILPDTASLLHFARELAAGGVTLLQYRNKSANARPMLEQAMELRKILRPDVKLMIDDRSDLCIAANCDGVHVGQEDLSPEAVRRIIGPDCWLGVSTHNPGQVQEADLTSANYIAIGPVFATCSKQQPDPVVGLEGVSHARRMTNKPLVAIGGITRMNCRSVIEAGADAVAVIGDLVQDPGKSAEEFLRILM
jgi:thiamine-phosphate pyrophosphorylase